MPSGDTPPAAIPVLVRPRGVPAERFGWDGGFGASWLVDPAADLTVIVLTQRMFETSEAREVHRDIQAAAYAALV